MVTKKKKTTSSNFFKEALALILLLVASLLTLSVVSYSPFDNTLLSANPDSTGTLNYIGPFGSNIATVMIQLLGFASYLIPLTLFTVGACLIMRVEIRSAFTKTIGILGLIAGISILLSYIFPQLILSDVNHQFPGGGIVGQSLMSWLIPVFGDLGLLIISIGIVGISLLLTIHFSFSGFFRSIVSGFGSASGNLKKRKKYPVTNKKKKAPAVVVRLNVAPFWRRKNKGDDDLQENIVTKELDEDFDGPLLTHLMKAENSLEDEEFIPQIRLPRRKRIVPNKKLVGMQLPIDLLDKIRQKQSPLNLKIIAEQARAVEACYREFGIEGKVLQTNPGPVVNTFEFKPAPGIKYNRVVNLANELCLALKAISVRISRIAGKGTIGIEVPNGNRETIFFREMITSPEYQNSISPLTIGLGKDISGDPYVSKLDDMPHLLIGGATGTGKSVALNSMICSILYKCPPETTKFILIDPKQVELSPYNGIPHLLTPVVSHPKKAASALRWACEEMEIRYRKLAEQGVRNISQYNDVVSEISQQPGPLDEDIEELETMPYIVVVIDELADLMMISSVDVEESICRLAQKARAVGIHLIIATQRPSVDVLTGVIKANFPCRISFGVFSKVDSRVILDSYGAEDLLGKGDMLFMPPGSSRLVRLHGALINEKEVKRLVSYLKKQNEPVYDQGIIAIQDEAERSPSASMAPEKDSLYEECVNLVLTTGVASISNLQRKKRLGYARAARIIDMMEAEGIVGPADGSKPREILKKQIS